VAAAVWHGDRLDSVDARTLRGALRLATANRVAAALADVFADRLGDDRSRLAAGRDAYRRNLSRVIELLAQANIHPILVKADPDDEYGNFDLVVGTQAWKRALEALRPWTVRRERYWLEPDKVICRPSGGPAAHLHHDVAWFGVTVIRAECLRENARRSSDFHCEVPAVADEVRILLAHAAFQNLAIDLFELLRLRGMLTPDVSAEARRRASMEGWGRSFAILLELVVGAIDHLDAGGAPELPVPIPPREALAAGIEHGLHLVRRGHPVMAGRELILRLPLIAAKTRRRRRGAPRPGVIILGFSGSDGSGKTSAATALVAAVERRGGAALAVHTFGCTLCRRLPGVRSPRSVGAHDRGRIGGPATIIRDLHGLIDAGELAMRLLSARVWLGWRPAPQNGGDVKVLVTDRSPLDGLVKHDPAPTSLVGRAFMSLARRYVGIIWLDASPEVLAARDGGHGPDVLGQWRLAFEHWAPHLTGVQRVDTMSVSAADTAEAALDILTTVEHSHKVAK